MYKKCFANCLNKFLLQTKPNCSNYAKHLYSNHNQYKNVITSALTESGWKWLNKELVRNVKKASYLKLNLIMVTYYYKASEKNSPDEILSELLDVLQSELSDQNYDAAEDVLQVGLKVAEEHKMYKIWSDLSYTLALIALSQNQLEKAQNVLTDTIEQLHIWGFQEDDHQIIDLKFCLANVLSLEGKNEMADMGFKLCLAQQQIKISGKDNTDNEIMLYIDILFYYGLHMMKQELYQEARENIEKAYSFISNIGGVPLAKKMLIIYKKAELNEYLGDYKSAFHDIIEVTTLARETGSPDTPKCYKKLAEICVQMQLYKEAKDAYEEALRYAIMFFKLDCINDLNERIAEVEKYLK